MLFFFFEWTAVRFKIRTSQQGPFLPCVGLVGYRRKSLGFVMNCMHFTFFPHFRSAPINRVGTHSPPLPRVQGILGNVDFREGRKSPSSLSSIYMTCLGPPRSAAVYYHHLYTSSLYPLYLYILKFIITSWHLMSISILGQPRTLLPPKLVQLHGFRLLRRVSSLPRR